MKVVRLEIKDDGTCSVTDWVGGNANISPNGQATYHCAYDQLPEELRKLHALLAICEEPKVDTKGKWSGDSTWVEGVGKRITATIYYIEIPA